jgi:hypothetical protein
MHGSQFNRTVAPIDFARVHLDWVSIVLAWFPSFRKRFRRSRPLRYLLASRYAATTTFLGVLWHFSFSFFILAYETVVATIQLGVFISLTTVYAE